MLLVDLIKSIIMNFDIKKGLGKALLGALAAAIVIIIQNPQAIASILPDHWKAITLVGLIVEGLDYIVKILQKKAV